MNDEIRQKFLKKIEAVEGREYKMYMLEGIPHIGIGHNIVSRNLSDETLEFLGIDDQSELMAATLNDDQCEYLFFKDLDIAVQDTKIIFNAAPDGSIDNVFDSLTEERQEVLVDMSFNLGRPRFSKFKKLIAAVRAGDYDEAAAQILDSKAARDPLTANRYADLADRMRPEQDTVVEAPQTPQVSVGTQGDIHDLIARMRECLNEIEAKVDSPEQETKPKRRLK